MHYTTVSYDYDHDRLVYNMGSTSPLIYIIRRWIGTESNLKQAKAGMKVSWHCGVSTAKPLSTDGNRASDSTADESHEHQESRMRRTDRPEAITRQSFAKAFILLAVQNDAKVAVSSADFLIPSLQE